MCIDAIVDAIVDLGGSAALRTTRRLRAGGQFQLRQFHANLRTALEIRLGAGLSSTCRPACGLKYAVGRDEIRLDTLGGGLKDKDVVDLVYV